MRIVLKPEALNAFGPVFKRFRERARPPLTQEDVAARITLMGLPMDRSVVSRIENQKRCLTDRELTYFLAALNVPAGYIFRIMDDMARLVRRRSASTLDDEDNFQVLVAEDPPEY